MHVSTLPISRWALKYVVSKIDALDLEQYRGTMSYELGPEQGGEGRRLHGDTQILTCP